MDGTTAGRTGARKLFVRDKGLDGLYILLAWFGVE